MDSEDTYHFGEQEETIAVREVPRPLPVRDDI